MADPWHKGWEVLHKLHLIVRVSEAFSWSKVNNDKKVTTKHSVQLLFFSTLESCVIRGKYGTNVQEPQITRIWWQPIFDPISRDLMLSYNNNKRSLSRACTKLFSTKSEKTRGKHSICITLHYHVNVGQHKSVSFSARLSPQLISTVIFPFL